MKKKFQVFLCGILLVGVFSSLVIAATMEKKMTAYYGDITLQVNGRTVTLKGSDGSEVYPFISDDGVTYLPVRATAEIIGKEVSWDGATKTINLTDKSSNPSNTPKITKAEYDSLVIGMSYARVCEIIGGPGKLMAESGNARIYMWEGVGSIGANAQMVFMDGKLYSKAQYGLS